jgi:hypothetical protein
MKKLFQNIEVLCRPYRASIVVGRLPGPSARALTLRAFSPEKRGWRYQQGELFFLAASLFFTVGWGFRATKSASLRLLTLKLGQSGSFALPVFVALRERTRAFSRAV